MNGSNRIVKATADLDRAIRSTIIPLDDSTGSLNSDCTVETPPSIRFREKPALANVPEMEPTANGDARRLTRLLLIQQAPQRIDVGVGIPGS